MTSKRIYRDELDLDYTLKEITNNEGKQFDPEITDVFLSIFDEEETPETTGDKAVIQKLFPKIANKR